MKRTQYLIRMNGTLVAVKYAWNAALREMQNQARKIARAECLPYYRTESSAIRGADGFHVAGAYKWLSPDGAVLEFKIEKATN